MLKDLTKITLNKNSSLKDALKLINKNGMGLCFVINKKKRILGSLSDGDVRKGLIKGLNLSSSVKKIMNKNALVLNYSLPLDKIIKHFSDKIKVIPLINSNKQIVDYVSFYKDNKIFLAKPDLGGNELKYISKCIKTGWISSIGEYIPRFEKHFSQFTKIKNPIAVSNGTTALQLAIEALGIGKNDEVILPTLTFAAPVNAVIHSGANPVFVDVKEDTFCIDENRIVNAINKKTKAVIVVHLYGHPANMGPIITICKKYKLKLIEDCAEALGSKYKKIHVGNFGDASCFSFFGNKTITTGEGGIVTFKKKKLLKKAIILRDHGMSKKVKYWHDYVGYNFRMTNLQAAIGTAQFERANLFVKNKIEIAKIYKKYLSTIKNIQLPKSYGAVKNTYWLYTIRLTGRLAKYRDKLLKFLSLNGVESRRIFIPMHIMPIYNNFLKKVKNNYKVSEEISESSLSLPSSYGLQELDIKNICSLIKKFFININKKND
jgi:perosamine synthetase